MKTSDFYYDLPQELIAQTPIEPRNASRLMLLDKKTGEIEHKIFKDLTDYLVPGDCLILNDTRVIPARIFGVKKETGAVVEFLLLKQHEYLVWWCVGCWLAHIYFESLTSLWRVDRSSTNGGVNWLV